MLQWQTQCYYGLNDLFYPMTPSPTKVLFIFFKTKQKVNKQVLASDLHILAKGKIWGCLQYVVNKYYCYGLEKVKLLLSNQ